MGPRGLRLDTAVAIAAVALVGGMGFFLFQGQAQSRQQLEQRFALRAQLAARFIDNTVRGLAGTESSAAAIALGTRDADSARMHAVIAAFHFQAAVLLDRRGRLLAVWPPKPSILGSYIARDPRYGHLRRALRGQTALSGVVPSAARGIPVVAIAVPFQTRFGRRVFSGALDIRRGPLSLFLQSAPTVGDFYLVDARGRIISSSGGGTGRVATLAENDGDLAHALATRPSGHYTSLGNGAYFVSQPVRDGWRIVASAPTADLYGPIGGVNRWAPWIVFAALVLVSLAVFMLLRRLHARRVQLAAQNDQLRQLDRLKDDFVSTVSHELRTPLTSIVAYIEPLIDEETGPLNEEQKQFLTVVDRNVGRLRTLVNDLLFVAQVEAGRLSLELEDVALDDVAEEAVEAAALRADEKGVALTLSAEAVPPLRGDRRRLAQLTDNLVSNAVKFTERGGEVHVRVRREGRQAVLEVADDGIGIPEEEQEQLFQRFFRSSTAVAGSIQGTGLGLAISRSIVDAHGGRISLKSREGEGTTVRVELPVHAAATVNPTLAEVSR